MRRSKCANLIFVSFKAPKRLLNMGHVPISSTSTAVTPEYEYEYYYEYEYEDEEEDEEEDPEEDGAYEY